MGYSKFFFCLIILIIFMLSSLFGSLFHSTPLRIPNNHNLTLMGDAHFREDSSLCLTSTSSSPPPSSSSFIGVGKALYSDPIRFKNSSNNATTASFVSKFTFTITPDFSHYHPLFGDGFTFIIASKSNTIGNAFGYMGLSNLGSHEQGIYIAVEFDTTLDPTLEDISDNHIGIDVSSVLSYPVVDSSLTGFSLKNVSKTTIWIEYSDPEKLMKIWLSYDAEFIPLRPILVTRMDLSTYIEELMFVGFTASSGKLGSSKHVIHSWQFKTYPSPFDTSFSLHSEEEGSDPADGAGSILMKIFAASVCTVITWKMFFSRDRSVGADQTIFDALADAPVVATENPTKKVEVKKNKARRNDKGRSPAADPAPLSKEEAEVLQFRKDEANRLREIATSLSKGTRDAARDKYVGLLQKMPKQP